MNPWIIITAVSSGIVFVTDYLLRKKKWKDNSKEEKISLLINAFSVGPYIFLSVLASLWGIVAYSPKTAIGKGLYEATLLMGTTYFIVAVAAVILSIWFRKKGKIKASIRTNVIAFVYIVAVLAFNSFVGKVL